MSAYVTPVLTPALEPPVALFKKIKSMQLNNKQLVTSTASSVYDEPIQTQEERLAALEALIAAGGPKPGDYPITDQFIHDLYDEVKEGAISNEEVAQLKSLFTEDFLLNTVQGHGFRKPMGYAGDFKIIDLIYTRHVNAGAAYKNWDEYFHRHPATRAVRNRKDFFKDQMLQKLNSTSDPVSLLNVASGPARDLAELFETIDPNKLRAVCVELDERAIEYASDLCRDFLHQITFTHKNILRFNTTEKFDVIWSAGLFDYFDDKAVVMILKRFLTWLKPGGEIILGNFSKNNPSRGYMELFGEWFLIHRSIEELMSLAQEAGASPENITVAQEPLGINLFLKIKNV